MKLHYTACATALALLASAGAASAQEITWSPSFGVTSDYVFRGITQSDEGIALQAGIEAGFGGFYAGVWGSTVEFGDGTQAEYNLYGGYSVESAGFEWDFGFVSYIYDGDPVGAGYDFVEFSVAASRAIGPASFGAAVHYSPNFSEDDAVYLELNAGYALIDNLSFSGAVGHQYLAVGDDYLTWNLGATYDLSENLSLDVRYHDTDLNTPATNARVSVSLGIAF